MSNRTLPNVSCSATVPPVRPLLRRTVKRFLKLLPSVLLVLFVVSLVFVTLMQIAVIHSHRRALLFPSLNGSNIYRAAFDERTATSASKSAFKSSNATGANNANKETNEGGKSKGSAAKKKAEVLRIEALLDRTSPSYEANVKMLQNFVNSARIKEIIQFARDISSSTSTSPVLQEITTNITAQNAPNSSRDRALQTTAMEEHSTQKLDHLLTSNLSLCPSVPPRLGECAHERERKVFMCAT